MALGGIVLYVQQNLNQAGARSIILSGSAFSAELRVRFPGPTNAVLPPSELSGALLTLSDGSTGAKYLSLWYEKPSATSTTGNVYLTSSAGRLEMVSASIFDDSFYNLTLVRERSTGSMRLYAERYSDGTLAYSTSSMALDGAAGCPPDASYTIFEIGSSAALPSKPQFWGQEARLWSSDLTPEEVDAHAADFLSFGRDSSIGNQDLLVHWRLDDGTSTNGTGKFYATDSTLNGYLGTGSNFTANSVPFTRFQVDHGYIPSIDWGWNQKKIRVFSGSAVEQPTLYRNRGYRDEKFVSLEFNMVDALNEDISHIMSSYDEMLDFIGYPVNRYREDYDGILQMRETYFQRLQGELNFRVFADMLDFFDRSFVEIVRRLLPARALFKGDEIIVESHMLERPKYQYQVRPVQDGLIDVSGSIAVTDMWGEIGR